MSFINNLKLAMKHRNIKNIDLINNGNVNKNQIKYWETHHNLPKVDTINGISEFLNVPVDLLLSDKLTIEDIDSHDKKQKKAKKQTKEEITAMSEATKAIASEQLANNQLAATPMEQTLLDAFRATTDEGRMAILEAALKAKMANEGSDVAQKKES